MRDAEMGSSVTPSNKSTPWCVSDAIIGIIATMAQPELCASVNASVLVWKKRGSADLG